MISIQSISDALNDFVVSKTLPEKVNILPLGIMVEPTTRCNLKCSFCPRRNIASNDLSIEQFEHILSQFPYLSNLIFVGLGETFVNKDIFKMIVLAKARKIRISAYTNGLLINENLGNQILESGLDEILFSIDGGCKETYEKLRPGSDFELLKDNIKKFVDNVKNSNSDFKVRIATVRMKDNISELPKIVELAASLGIDDVDFENLETVLDKQSYFRKFTWVKSQALHLASPSEKIDFKKTLDLTFKKAQQLGVKISMDKTLLPLSKRGNCSMPWLTASIRANGDVNSCCLFGLHKLGNIFEQDFEEIWNNNNYQVLRRQLKSGKSPKGCDDCGRKFN